MTDEQGKVKGRMNFRGRRQILIALIAESMAALAVLAAVQIHFAVMGTDLSLFVKLAIACVSAGTTALLLRAPVIWALFLAVLPALLVLTLRLDMPIWVPLAILCGLVLILRNTLTERVPLYLSNVKTIELLCGLLPREASIRVIDLGCGLGDVPVALARYNHHPDSRFIGIENAPVPFILAWIAAWQRGDPRVEIHFQSLWHANLNGVDMIYAFLSPHPMPDLYAKIRAEVSDKGIFVSNSFTVPGHPPDRLIPIKTGRATDLLIWNLPITNEAHEFDISNAGVMDRSG